MKEVAVHLRPGEEVLFFGEFQAGMVGVGAMGVVGRVGAKEGGSEGAAFGEEAADGLLGTRAGEEEVELGEGGGL
jgi:hypothetical protein